MKEIIIKIFFALIVAVIAWLTNDKKSLVAFIIVAIVPFLLYDIILEKFSNPKARVSLRSEKDKINVSVVSEKPVILLDVDLPIFGEVTKIYDFAEAGNVKISKVLNNKSKFIIYGRESYQSFIQIHIENLLPNKECRYVLEIKPIDKDITFIGGTDTYKVSYQWTFNGDTKTKTNWFSTETGRIVKEPKVKQGLYKVYN